MARRCRPLLGTFVEVAADGPGAIDAAFDAIERVHRLMSAHEENSDVSRINRFAHMAPVKVADWTALVLERAFFWARRSGGAFDIVRAGRRAIQCGSLPRHADQPMPEAAHWTWLEIQGLSVRLRKAGCVDLGGIAKGFAVDRAIEALRQAGCERGLVNAGGDLRVFGPEPFAVEMADPLTRRSIGTVELRNAALATSAGLPLGTNSLSFDHLGGKNPQWTSVSVQSRTACDADALTKIVWNMDDGAERLLEEIGASAFGYGRAGQIEAIGEKIPVLA